MTRHPVFVSTSFGPVAGVVHEPEGNPSAAVVLLAGGTGRAGPNRVWARLAESLAANGLVAFRVDDRDVEDPALRKDYAARTTAASEAILWFRHEVSGLDLLLAGRCMGARICLAFAATQDDVAGVGLVAPRLNRGALQAELLAKSGGFAATLKRAASRAKRLAPSFSDPGTRIKPGDQGQLDPEFQNLMAGFDRSRPVWILLGEDDTQWRSLWTPETRSPELAGADVEIMPGTLIRSNRTLRSQEAVIDRVTAWAVRTVELIHA